MDRGTIQMQRILTVPKEPFLHRFSLAPYEGDGEKMGAILAWLGQNSSYHPRQEAERDLGLLQLIAYGSILHAERVFLLRRRGSNRHDIKDRYAIALGGHVDEQDAPMLGGPIFGALFRELSEELFTPEVVEIRQCGFVYDTGTPGSSLHLCVYYQVKVNSDCVRTRDDDAGLEFRRRTGRSKSGTFVEVSELDQLYPSMDPWSRILTRYHFHRPVAGATSEDFLQTTLPYLNGAV